MIPVILVGPNSYYFDVGTFQLGNVCNDCLINRYILILSRKYSTIYILASKKYETYKSRFRNNKRIKVIDYIDSGSLSEFSYISPIFSYGVPVVFFDINLLFDCKLLNLLDNPYKTEIVYKKSNDTKNNNIQVVNNQMVSLRGMTEKTHTYLGILKFGIKELELAKDVFRMVAVKPSLERGTVMSIIDCLNDQNRLYLREYKGNALKIVNNYDLKKAKKLYKSIKNDYTWTLS